MVDRVDRGTWNNQLRTPILLATADAVLEIAPINYLRGRSIHDAVVIVDDGQNLTQEDMKLVLTRAGEGTRVILTGDPDQIDRPEIDALSREIAGKARVVLVHVGNAGDEAEVRRDRGVTMDAAKDTFGKQAEKYCTASLPRIVVVGTDGKVRKVLAGVQKDVKKAITDAVKK